MEVFDICSILFIIHIFLQFELPRDIVDDNGAVTNSMDRMEENGTLEYGDEDGSTIHEADDKGEGEEEEEEEEDEEEDEHPGEMSIGKKIFKFFTT